MSEKGYPLEGIKVLDFTRVLSGPFCTMLLGDLGAEVIKVERPGVGDENRKMRTYEGRTEQDEDYFYPMNRNKKSITINLKSSEEREKLKPLIAEADVIVENFVHGNMAKFNLDYESIRQINEKIIYCSISGFGQEGPYKNRKAYDSIVQAMTGVMSITGEPGGRPLRSGLNFGDLTASMYAFSSIVTSLYAREKTGLGNYIDTSMSDSLLSLFSTNAAEYLAIGATPQAVGAEIPGRSPTGSMQCSDGKYIQVMGGSDVLWPKFCQVIDRTDLEHDARFTTNELRIKNRDELREIIIERLKTKTSAEWVDTFNNNDVPCSPINTLPEVFEDEHFQARNMDLRLNHPISGEVRNINNAFRFSSYKTTKNSPPPLLGEHQDDILK